jgi:hypothetical protein
MATITTSSNLVVAGDFTGWNGCAELVALLVSRCLVADSGVALALSASFSDARSAASGLAAVAARRDSHRSSPSLCLDLNHRICGVASLRLFMRSGLLTFYAGVAVIRAPQVRVCSALPLCSSLRRRCLPLTAVPRLI